MVRADWFSVKTIEMLLYEPPVGAVLVGPRPVVFVCAGRDTLPAGGEPYLHGIAEPGPRCEWYPVAAFLLRLGGICRGCGISRGQDRRASLSAASFLWRCGIFRNSSAAFILHATAR